MYESQRIAIWPYGSISNDDIDVPNVVLKLETFLKCEVIISLFKTIITPTVVPTYKLTLNSRISVGNYRLVDLYLISDKSSRVSNSIVCLPMQPAII